jgi:hypothetical protein
LGSIGKLPVAIVSLDKGAAQENPDTPPFLLDTFMDSWRSNGTLLTDLGLSYDVKTNKYCAKATDQFTFTNIDYISSTYEYANDNDPSKFASYDDTQEAQIDR